jgi:kynurenine formamidase
MDSRVVDLTQPLGPDTVLWPGSTPVRAEVVMRIETDGSYARDLHTPEHAGTHLDAPAHFVADGARVDEIPADRLVVPCAVLDISREGRTFPDYALEADAIEEFERRDGPIAAGSAVLVRTGWEDYRGDRERYLGGETERDLGFPGLGANGAELLIERGVVGIGVDTVSVDAGSATDFPVHRRTLPAGLWHLEGLVNLAALPARGATLFVGVLRLVEGSGAPARVLALVPALPES